MIELLAPSFTKKVPMIDVMMQAPQISSGYSIALERIGEVAKKIEARTMVATTVTA